MKKITSISEVLVRGGDLLGQTPHFKLVGRDQELKELMNILMKMRKRNLLLTGRAGVGMSAIVLGLQASKAIHTTPADIVAKRFFWLNTDRLFESGQSTAIGELFEKVRNTLSRSKESVLVIEDTIDFFRAAQTNGCSHFINGLMGDIKAGRYQAIFECKDEHLGEILKSDGDIQETCTLYELKEPSAENTVLMVTEVAKELHSHHGIRIDEKAIRTAVTLTEKYKLVELRAQPDAAITLLDLALTTYRRVAHSEDPRVPALLVRKGKGEDVDVLISEARAAWETMQKEIRTLYRDIREGEEEITRLEDEIEHHRQVTAHRAQELEASKSGGEYRDTNQMTAFSRVMGGGNLDTPEIAQLKGKIDKIQSLVDQSSLRYQDKLAALNADLQLDEGAVLSAFSSLSGIPADRLNEDEMQRLRDLDKVLAQRVVGQPEPTMEVAKAVKRSRLGLKMPNKPAGCFMFLGPSGVGKTELAKALAEALQVPLLRFDMSEYMEKHAVSKLIGAPPGYEGYEHGGILTNAARKNPYSVVLFDEIEKAHVDVFNVMLQLLDDARLTDSRGLTASFKDTIVIMTTNIGTPHFLDESLQFEQAKELALADLRVQYRPEFLGRFGGNIYCFQRLGMEVLLAISKKDISRINGLISDRGITLTVADDQLEAMIRAKYSPREGARSILGYIDRNITSGIADVVLQGGGSGGNRTIQVTFNSQSSTIQFK